MIGALAGNEPRNPRRRIRRAATPETRAKLSKAKTGKRHSEHHRAAIKAGMANALRFRHFGRPRLTDAACFDVLTDAQKDDYLMLRKKGGYGHMEALAIVSRPKVRIDPVTLKSLTD